MREGLKLYYQVTGLRGLMIGALGTLAGFQKTVQVRIPGSGGFVRLRLPSTDVTTFRQILMSEEYKLDVWHPPRTIIDAGANVGLSSVYFASQFPDARIIAVEPESRNFELLEENTAPYPKIEPVRAALWFEDAEIYVLDPGLGESGFTTDGESEEQTAAHRREPVRALTIETLMEETGINHVDLLKVDIEGAELQLFQHADHWINKVDAIAIELHDRIKPGCEQAFRAATRDFGISWSRGENTYCARTGAFVRRPDNDQ